LFMDSAKRPLSALLPALALARQADSWGSFLSTQLSWHPRSSARFPYQANLVVEVSAALPLKLGDDVAPGARLLHGTINPFTNFATDCVMGQSGYPNLTSFCACIVTMAFVP
jgi:hypothetical protein